MRTYTETRREGELLGPVDWAYDFSSHFTGYCTDQAGKDHIRDEHVERLRQLTDGQWGSHL